MKKNSPLFSEIRMALLDASFLIQIKHTQTHIHTNLAHVYMRTHMLRHTELMPRFTVMFYGNTSMNL